MKILLYAILLFLLFASLLYTCTQKRDTKTVSSGIAISGKPKSGIGILSVDSTWILTSKRRTCGMGMLDSLFKTTVDTTILITRSQITKMVDSIIDTTIKF